MSERNNSIQELLGQTDIYLVDQIMKNRFDLQDNILDAGCGNGRNMHWFLRNDYKIYGIDSDNEIIATLKKIIHYCLLTDSGCVQWKKLVFKVLILIISSPVQFFILQTIHHISIKCWK